MDRRSAIMTMSGVLATSALVGLTGGTALAQTASEPTTKEKIGQSAYKTRTLDVGSFSKAMSQIALTRASHPKVKEFAEFEVAEQTTMAQVLTDMANPPPPKPDAQQAATLKQLDGESGKSFDTAYVQAQITGHHELLTTQQEYLNGMPTSLDHEHIAMLARTVIQMHLTMLHDLQNELTA